MKWKGKNKKMDENIETPTIQETENCEQAEIIDKQAEKSPEDALKAANEKYLRVLAEFDNFRKRTERERTSYFENGTRDALLKVLPTLDSLERALSHDDGQKFREGVEMIYNNLKAAFESLGVTEIDAHGAFDPNVHNAVMHVEDDALGANAVAEELQKGYMYKDKPLRYSMVKVAN